MAPQADSQGFQHQVVDGVLLAGLGQQHLAELHQVGDVHLDVLGDGRDLGVGGQHPLGNHLAHTGQLHHSVTLHQIQAGLGSSRLGSGSGRGGRSSSHRRGSVLLGLGGSQDISLADTAGGAGADDVGVVHTQLGSGLAGQGGDADAGAVCGSHRSGSSGGGSGSGLHGGRSGRSGSGGSAAHGLAGLADVGQQALDGDILTLLGHDLQQDAVEFAGDLVGQLIGGDLHDHIAHLHLIAFVLDPGGDSALFHGQAQLRHQYFMCHVDYLLTCSGRA